MRKTILYAVGAKEHDAPSVQPVEHASAVMSLPRQVLFRPNRIVTLGSTCGTGIHSIRFIPYVGERDPKAHDSEYGYVHVDHRLRAALEALVFQGDSVW